MERLSASRPFATWQLKRFLPWLLLAVGFALVLVLRTGIASLPDQAGVRPFLDVWLRIWIFFSLLLVTLIVYCVRRTSLWLDILCILLGVVLAGVVLFGLKNTSYALNGVQGDQGFLTAQVTKFTYTARSVDFAYKDLPAYYPPLYYYLLGRFAAITQVEAYRTLKYGLIVVVFLLPYLTYRMWKLVLPSDMAVLPVFSIFLFQDWYKPPEWLSLSLFIPWWLYFIENVGGASEQRGWKHHLVGGLLGALLFTTYYYWFFIGVTSLALVTLIRRWLHLEEANFSLAEKLKTLGLAALFSSPYWGPYLISMASTGGWKPLQNRYFIDSFVHLEFPFFDPSIQGVLLLAGLLYCLSKFRSSQLAFGLTGLLLGALVWQLLGYPAFLLDTPLLTFKARDFVMVALAVAAPIGIYEFFNGRAAGNAVTIASTGLLLLMFLSHGMVQQFVASDLLTTAFNEKYPREHIEAYQAVTGSQAGEVLLADTNNFQISVYLPVYQFLPWAAHYSHPAGLYEERLTFLRLLSETERPEWFAAALMNNRYTHIDQILLVLDGEAYSFKYRPDNFPYPTESELLAFPQERFDERYFEARELGGQVLLTPRYSADPLEALELPIAGLRRDTRFGDIGDADDMLEFLTRFGDHLEFPDKDQLLLALQDLFAAN